MPSMPCTGVLFKGMLMLRCAHSKSVRTFLLVLCSLSKSRRLGSELKRRSWLLSFADVSLGVESVPFAGGSVCRRGVFPLRGNGFSQAAARIGHSSTRQTLSTNLSLFRWEELQEKDQKSQAFLTVIKTFLRTLFQPSNSIDSFDKRQLQSPVKNTVTISSQDNQGS